MFDSNNPEINIDELMQKIREEVAKRQVDSQPLAAKNHADITDLISKIGYIESLLINAEARACARTKWPDKLNRFPLKFSSKLQKFILKLINFLFKDQREVNLNLILALKASVTVNRQLIEQINTLKTQIDERLINVDSRFQGIDERLVNVDSRFQGIDERLINVDSRFQGIDERLVNVDSHFQGIDERLVNVDSHFQGIDECLDVMDIRFQGIDHSLNTVNKFANNYMTDMEEKLNNFKTHIQGMDERHIRNDNYLKNDLIQQKRMIALFLEEARGRLPQPFNQQQMQTFLNEDQHLLDAFYVAFEDQFRGSREQILNRLKVYLPLIEEAKIGSLNSPILDLGCGRGEWLQLLRDSGYTAKGIDINRVMQEQCQARKLDVVESDVILYLQSLPDDSLGAVTGFHIIEHLEFPVLIKLLEEVVRVLKPEGIAIFETPNPKNLVVGACNFYSDPTHRNPVFPETIQFCMRFKGLSNVQLLYLNPVENSPFDKQDIESVTLNDWFFCSRDYAVIGYKK
ncbi:class I SAM-dependent methyltransferase [Nostoc sp. 'Lobaria pulmonaria (5183) cyanobiont']|uniref:class I SAM-dependent methyltransferase n=1 Tax=Nostoc sp. 'Lobaria pulmonaria (5183) cyanobiont' TaxID=1618022 RepID=UPI000CF350DB|nr:class I SAM-dependent methyltransferase [Nostoc sp. 'Lobaria pulmonaria (5183) cyanobiont']AVH70502.1 methyltransferase [Nostoc sp. 'Lobaria pulmonaria (5183) cyanobiont']